ncbi:MAG: hypothetical protein ABL888_16810 [Pirellulaceae bacterium]
MVDKVDPDRVKIFKECMESYGIGTDQAEWPNNILSRKLVVYESGMITRSDDSITRSVDAKELDLCKTLANIAREMIGEIAVGMGSQSMDSFSPFFVCAEDDSAVPQEITESLIRERFGGTIFPLASITVEPLKQSGTWWNEVLKWVSSDAHKRDLYLKNWQRTIDWFNSSSDFCHTSFVRIGDRKALWAAESGELPTGTELTGCVLPRLALGLTNAGSLVGIFGFVVQS